MTQMKWSAVRGFSRFVPMVLFIVGCQATTSVQVGGPINPSPKAGYMICAHSHNDYEQTRPLLDALDNEIYSIEADIWLVDGVILVAHNRGEYKGSLKELYLDPLQARVDEMGSVYGNGVPVYLWIDLKPSDTAICPVLHKMLSGYSMLTRFTDTKIHPGAVTVILTGTAAVKKYYVETYTERYACRDDNHYNPSDPPVDNRWQWYALHWPSCIEWDGKGAIPQNEYLKLVTMVDDMHRKGRRVRFYATPETDEYRTLAIQVGIDHINTDHLSDLKRFLKSYR